MKNKKKATGIYQTPLEKKQKNIALFFFIYCLAIIPFFNLNTLIDPAVSSKFTALAAGMIFFIFLYVFINLKYKSTINLSPFKKLIFPVLLVYIVFPGLSVFNAINPSEAVFDFLKNGVIFIFFLFSTLLLVNSKILPSVIARIIVVFSFLILLVGLFQTFNVVAHEPIRYAVTRKVYGVFMNKNLYSQMLFLTLPFNLFGFYVFRNRWKTLCSFNLAVTFFLIVILFTRSVWLAFITSSIFTLAFVSIYNYKKKNDLIVFGKRITGVLIFILAAITVVFLLIAVSQISNTSKSLIKKDISTSKGRIVMWKKSLEMFKGHPVFGVGGGNWKILIPDYGVYDELRFSGKKRFQRPHNDYLWILTEYGIIGLLAFVSVLIIGLFYLVRIIDLSENKEDRLFYLLLFFGLTGYLTFSFFSYPKERIEISIYFYFILSLIVAKHFQLTANKTTNTSAGNFLFIMLPFVIILLTASYAGVKRIQGESHARRAIDALHSNRFETAINEIDKGYSWFYSMDPTATPLLWYKGLANFRKGNAREALNNFLAASAINPFHSHTYNSIGIVYATEGNFVKAKEYFLNSLKLRPYSTETIVNLAKIYIQGQNYGEAYQVLKKVKPNSKNTSFKIIMVKVLDYKIDQLADSIRETKIRDYILKVKGSKANTFSIYQSSAKKGRSFKSQFLNDVATDMMQHDTILNNNQLKQLNKFLIRK